MMNSGGRTTMRFPFTASQWQELEHQALVYKYMASGMPIPPDLLYTIRRSLDSSMSSKFLIHQPQMGWNGFQMGFGRKIDPEPGRCRRTDGKKWRCSKEAYTDSKYCERHMHRGRNRSRKPVEILNHSANNNTIPIISPTKPSSPPNAIPITKNTESHFLYPHFTPSRLPSTAGMGLSSPQESSTNFNFLEPNSYSHHAQAKDYGHVMKVENSSDDQHHLFFSSSEASSNNIGTMRNDSCWQLSPLTMGSPVSQMKHNSSVLQSGQHFHNDNKQHGHHYLSIEREDEPKKVNMHHFLDEWTPKDKADSWLLNSSSDHNKLSTSHHSLHDFFITQKW